MLVLIIILLLVLGGGGGYYGHRYDALVKGPAAPLPLSDVLVYLKQMVQGQIIEHQQ